jgi:TatD DNase family protein
MLVDSHCHLDDAKFDADREAVIDRARAAGVGRLLAVGSGPPDLEAGLRLAEAWSHIVASAGVHPHEASKATSETFERLSELLAHPKVVGVGEIGLDYHYDFSPRKVQREVFARQLAMARKPVIIHTREAWDDTVRLLAEHPGVRGVFHCFSGGPREAEQALAMGFYISFAGVVTFPKAAGIQEAARLVPADRLLVETDAPYLAPAPHRGKRNEPAFVVETTRRVAELRGETLEHLAAATTRNFERLFGAVAQPDARLEKN